MPKSLFYVPADQRRQDIQNGWWVIKKYNCMGCHVIQVGQRSRLIATFDVPVGAFSSDSAIAPVPEDSVASITVTADATVVLDTSVTRDCEQPTPDPEVELVPVCADGEAVVHLTNTGDLDITVTVTADGRAHRLRRAGPGRHHQRRPRRGHPRHDRRPDRGLPRHRRRLRQRRPLLHPRLQHPDPDPRSSWCRCAPTVRPSCT